MSDTDSTFEIQQRDLRQLIHDPQADAWRDVFQVVSDYGHLASREFIKLLEEARDKAGYGPQIPAPAGL